MHTIIHENDGCFTAAVYIVEYNLLEYIGAQPLMTCFATFNVDQLYLGDSNELSIPILGGVTIQRL